MRKLTLFSFLALLIGICSNIGCSKSNNNSGSSKTDTVYYSNWITLATTYNSTDSAYEQTITASKITQTALNNDVLLGYVQYQGSVFAGSDFGVYSIFNVGNIIVVSGLGDLTGGGVQYRYVIIPGNVAVTAFHGMTQQQISHMSFTEVNGLLNAATKQQPAAPQLSPQ